MTRIDASAPGKLVLLGEYAVLEGAPALVLAIDRRARVTLIPTGGDAWQIVSPTLGLEARLHLDAAGLHWHAAPPAQLAWLNQVFARFPSLQRMPACRVELDSDAFQYRHAGVREKLGLGSSAALVVALLGALHVLTGRTAPTLMEAVAVHRAIQQGRGSGIDIAAALAGGLSRFQLDANRTPRQTPLRLPRQLHWCCVYSGRPASTRAMLATVAAWRARAPGAYRRHLDELGTMAGCGADAVARDDSATFLATLHDYAVALARLGAASGADIASAAHRALGRIATECGCVYKSCGAGGGDVGVTFCVDDGDLQEFASRATRAGFPLIATQAEPRALEVTVVD